MRFFAVIFVSALILGISSCNKNLAESSVATESPYFNNADHIVNVEGLDVRYRDEGLKNAKALIMVHGFTSSLESWDALSENLANDYRVIRPDLPGHGLTGPDSQKRYSNEETVVFLSKFIDALDIETPVLIGNSLGGLVSWRVAAQLPEKISELVLVSPGGYSINGVTDEPVDVPMMLKFYLTKAPEAGVRQATSSLYADPEALSEERVTTIQYMMQRPGNGDAFVERLSVFTLPDPTIDLEKVKSPTLVVWGQQDKMIPVSQADWFSDALPDATLKIYENAGHVPQEETPEQLAQDIRLFLESAE